MTRPSVVTSMQLPREWRKSWERNVSLTRFNSFEREPVEQQDFTPPDGPITVGIDGGYVRKAHKEDSATYAPNLSFAVPSAKVELIGVGEVPLGLSVCTF